MKNTPPRKAKQYSSINLFVRSLIFHTVFALSCILYGCICLLASPFPLRIRYKVNQKWIAAMLIWCRFICHLDYQIEGLSHVKKIKSGIIMSKHQSAWETFFLSSSFDQVAMITKKELLWVPFLGWCLALLSPIAINRKDTKSAMQQIIQQGKRCLETGRWVVIFPEGTRVPAGQIGTYRIGGARLSVETGYPIVPMAHNAGRFWPKKKFVISPGLIRVAFGPPIDPQGKTAEEVLELTKSWIENKVLELEGNAVISETAL
jgi:1-acyl-sn-glycerol-3-phosphate acyltransferase